MFPLKQRTAAEGVTHHQQIPVRVYINDSVQKPRIDRSVRMAYAALVPKIVSRQTSINVMEVGCGTGDIAGSLAELLPGNYIVGVDCNEAAIAEAKLRWRHAKFIHSAIGDSLKSQWDLVILCEFLEHVENPVMVAKGCLSHADSSLISHPLNETRGSTCSGGDHQWSFTMEDHFDFFFVGGHRTVETEQFKMGEYQMIISRGQKR